MKKFFKTLRKKSPARGGPPPEGSPKLDNRSTHSTQSLAFGYDVREKELVKLHKAAWFGDVAKVLQLAKKDPSPIDKEKRTPLHLACVQGNENVVQELLAWKAKTNIGDADSRTPMMKAVECGREGCVDLLLEDKAELDSVDKDGNTCLHIAAMNGDAKIVKKLCQHGATMVIRNKEGLAPLHLAVRERQEDVCRTIISFRGQIDIEDNNLRTPLMYACQDGSINLVKLFLEKGASTVHKDSKGWSADDCAVIQGHHACSQLISDHLHRHQRGSAASTPRSAPNSRSATPRSPSPFNLPPGTPRDPDSATFGLPAFDAAKDGDESGDETLSKASAKGAGGSDSWGDDTDISQAEDKKSKGGSVKMNLAKLVGHLPSESDDAGVGETGNIAPKRASSKSYQSDISQDDSWAAADSPLSPRRRVSFKDNKELSQIHDITATESEAESDHYTTIPDTPRASLTEGYIPSAAPIPAAVQLSPEKQRGFMDDLGLGDADDISEFSDVVSETKPAPHSSGAGNAGAASDSDWDSTVKSDAPKHGILKKMSKVDNNSDWDTSDADDIPPPLPSAQPPLTKMVEEDSDLEEVMELGPPTTTPTTIPKEGNDSPEETPQDLVDKPSQDSEWDSTTDLATPRQNAPTAVQSIVHQESDWDSTVDAATPRGADVDIELKPQETADPVMTMLVDEELDEDEVQAFPQQTTGRGAGSALVRSLDAAAVDVVDMASVPVLQHTPEPKPHHHDDDIEEEESAWDSDGDMLPSEAEPALPLDPEVKGERVEVMQHRRPSMHDDTDTDDDMDKTETVSEWELEHQRQKEEKLQAELEKKRKEEERVKQEEEEERRQEQRRKQEEEEKERRRKEEERKQEEQRLQQEEEERRKREEEIRKRQEETRRQEEAREEEERKRKEEEERRRRLEWEREENIRVEQMKREAEEALKEEALHSQDLDSSEEDSLTGEEIKHKSITPSVNQLAEGQMTLNSCQNNSGLVGQSSGTSQNDAETQEELKRVEHELATENSGVVRGVKGGLTVSSTSGVHGSLQPQQSQGVPQSSSSPYLSGPTARQIKHRLQIGANTAPTAYHSDGMESDDSFMSDNDRHEVQSSYPPILGSTQSFRPDFNMADDDVLSYTSTEFEGNDPMPSSGPFTRDVLLNMNLSDPSTLVQVQDYIRETKRHMEQERNQRSILDNKIRLLAKDKQDLVRKLESITNTKQSLEQNKLDLEARIRSLEYNLSEEQEKKRNAEMLLTKTKEQLSRKEQQFTSELEGKQRAELTMRNIQLEMRAAQNAIKELEEEREELERQLQHEHSARLLQEQINEEQTRQHHDTLTSSLGSSAKFQEKMTEGDDDEEDRSERDKLSAELYAVKMEMDRQRSRFKDEITLMATENEELQSRLEELKNEIKLNEEAMAHATMQYNVQLGSLRSEVVNTSSTLDKEHALREKLETELDSLQKRLQGSVTEKDRAVLARNDLERECQLSKQNHTRDLEYKEEEINLLKDNNQHLNQRIHTLETKLNSMESEMHVSSTSLLERSNQLQQLRQDAERYKSGQHNFEANFRAEKEVNSKLQVKIESLQERLTQSQLEVNSLKQQVDQLHSASLNTTDPHEHISSVINTLRSDSERTKTMLEERNNSLLEQVQHLKEELRNSENRHNTVNTDLRRLHNQHAEVNHKLSFAEAQLQLLQKTKEQLEQERNQLKADLEKALERQRQSQEKCLESQTRVADLTERLDRAERTSQLSTQHLANTSASYSAVARSKEEMEDTVQRLQMENTRLESDLKHERERSTMLHSELNDSKKAKTEGSNAKEQRQLVETQLMEESQRNQQLQKEISNLKAHLKAAKKKIKSQVENGAVDVEGLQVELEMKYRRDLNSKLEEVNHYLETQALARDRLDTSRAENESRLSSDKRRLEEETNNLKRQYEQVLAQKESSEMEARRFKQLYESEMQWRIRLSDQLQLSTDKSLLMKSSLPIDPKSRLYSSVLNRSVMSDASFNVSGNHGLSNKIQAELDRSIARHLEAAPHSDIVPVLRKTEDALLSHSLSRSSKDYIDVLKRKYCVP